MDLGDVGSPEPGPEFGAGGGGDECPTYIQLIDES